MATAPNLSNGYWFSACMAEYMQQQTEKMLIAHRAEMDRKKANTMGVPGWALETGTACGVSSGTITDGSALWWDRQCPTDYGDVFRKAHQDLESRIRQAKKKQQELNLEKEVEEVKDNHTGKWRGNRDAVVYDEFARMPSVVKGAVKSEYKRLVKENEPALKTLWREIDEWVNGINLNLA